MRMLQFSLNPLNNFSDLLLEEAFIHFSFSRSNVCPPHNNLSVFPLVLATSFYVSQVLYGRQDGFVVLCSVTLGLLSNAIFSLLNVFEEIKQC